MMRSRYRELLKSSRKAEKLSSNPKMRIAFLTDFASQRFCQLTRGCLWELGVDSAVYEGEFGSFRQEILNDESGLYSFEPQYVFFALAPQNFSQSELSFSEVEPFLTRLLKKGITVISASMPRLNERIFGQLSSQIEESSLSRIVRYNRELHNFCQKNSQIHLFDLEFLSSRMGLSKFYDDKLWASSSYLCSLDAYGVLAFELGSFLSCFQGRVNKCVVLDLDNTLWGGVIGDDGLEGIKLNDHGEGWVFWRIQNYFKALRSRGIVLCVCSKNEESNAKLPFSSHPKMVIGLDDIAVFIANWNNKASNIEAIGKTLGLGLDSFIFIDDNPMERELVRTSLPEVKVPELPEDPHQWIKYLEEESYFNTLEFTKDDRRRADMYTEEAKRKSTQIEFEDIDDYLKSLKMEMQIHPLCEKNLERACQLMQRSNQFNLRTQRFNEADCIAFMKDENCFPLTVSLKDRFGDYGIISVVCCQKEEDSLNILEFVMSCRVLQRGVENAIFNYLSHLGIELNCRVVGGEYIRTPKNSLVEKLYSKNGFEKKSSSDDRSKWNLVLSQYRDKKHFIRVNSNEP